MARAFFLAAVALPRPLRRRISSESVPLWREGRPDEALVFRQRGDSGAILVIELGAERIKIGLLAFGTGGFRNHDDALLIEEPGDRHLSGTTTVLVAEAEEGERGITCRPPLREGAHRLSAESPCRADRRASAPATGTGGIRPGGWQLARRSPPPRDGSSAG